jgi:uncharacterized protein YbjT (DUF2867 family)
MRVLVVGVTGLIGSAIAARLSTLGHAIIGASRGTPKPGLVPMTYVSIDVAHAIDPADWLPHLVGIDAVVNCAGVFQDSPRDWTKACMPREPRLCSRPACGLPCAGSSTFRP